MRLLGKLEKAQDREPRASSQWTRILGDRTSIASPVPFWAPTPIPTPRALARNRRALRRDHALQVIESPRFSNGCFHRPRRTRTDRDG